LIEKLFVDTPFHGLSQLTLHPQNDGHVVNLKRIPRLMLLVRINRKTTESRPD
jgi:putative transposase